MSEEYSHPAVLGISQNKSFAEIFSDRDLRTNDCRALKNLVLRLPSASRSSILEALQTLEAQSNRARAIDIFLEYAHFSDSIDGSWDDKKVQSSLSVFFNSPEWKALKTPEAAKRGESREKAYLSVLKKFVHLSREIRIIDPYFATAANSGRTSRLWLLRRIVQDSDAPIVIFSDLAIDKLGRRLRFSEVQDSMKQLLKREISQVWRDKTSVKVLLLDKKNYERDTKNEFHRRSIQFRFTEKSTAFVLDKGLDDFSRDPLVKDTVLKHNARTFNTEFDMLRKYHSNVMELRYGQ